MMKKNVLKQDLIMLLAAAFFVLGYIALFFTVSYPLVNTAGKVSAKDTVFTVDAELRKGEFIKNNTKFMILCDVSLKIEAEELEKNIAIENNSFGFTVSKRASGYFVLIPDRLFDYGEKITIKVYGNAYDFEVLKPDPVVISGSLPSDKAQDVPINSGIELYIKGGVSESDLEEAFEIVPKINGKIEKSYYGDRYVYKTYNDLEYNTEYKVTISGGLKGDKDGVLEEDYVFSFKTEQKFYNKYNDSKYFEITSGMGGVNALSSEPPVFSAFVAGGLAQMLEFGDGGLVDIEVYSISAENDYIEGLKNKADYGSDFSPGEKGWEKAYEFSVQPINHTPDSYAMDSSNWIFLFPEEIEEGRYYCRFTLKDGSGVVYDSRGDFLQVSDMSVFYMATSSDVLVWLNDASTGRPISGAKVDFSGNYIASGVTGEDGTLYTDDVVYDFSQGGHIYAAKALLKIEKDGKSYIDYYYIHSSYYYDDEDIISADKVTAIKNSYFSYMYTDRPVYMTTDTIQVWGVVKPRDMGKTQAPDKAVIKAANAGKSYNVDILPDGTFTAEIAIDNLKGVYGEALTLHVDDVQLYYKSVSVEDYVKPVLKGELTTDKPLYMAGIDPAPVVSADISTFDGTPAVSVSVKFTSTYSGFVENPITQTDINGNAKGEFKYEKSPDSWYPVRYRYEVETIDEQSEKFRSIGYFYAIHRDIMLNTEKVPGENSLVIESNFVDISSYGGESDMWSKDKFKGAPADIDLLGEIYAVYYEKEITGRRYDYISRVMVDSYEYNRVEKKLEEMYFKTEGGRYVLSDLPEADGLSCYNIVISGKDSLGRKISTKVYLGREYYHSGESRSTKIYSVEPVGNNPGYIQEEREYSHYSNYYEYYEDWYGGYYDNKFGDNEDVRFILKENDNAAEEFKGKILYSIVQDNIGNIKISDKESFVLPFSEKLVPNYIITGAYFDGKHIYALEDIYMSFNPEARELELEIIPDKTQYLPGGEVQVSVKIKNKKTGQAAAGSSVLLSVVDEAVFAYSEQYPNLLKSLYSDVYWKWISKYTSYHKRELPGMGEMGGGDGFEQVREDFKDTAIFKTATADENGVASFKFKLPDNITSWRLTSLALSPENHAGNNKYTIDATKPFFVQPVVNESLIAGDSFCVGLRGAGKGLSGEEPVDYTVKIEGKGISETKTLAAGLREYAIADFELSLPSGDYTVTVSGSCRGYKDAVKLPLKVSDYGVEVNTVKTFKLADGIDINPIGYPVEIQFYGQQAYGYNKILRSVYNSSGTSRADSRLAEIFTRRLYAELAGREYTQKDYNNEPDITDLNGEYIFSLLKYSDKDLELTLRANLALPELVGDAFIGNGKRYSGRLGDVNGSPAMEQYMLALIGEEPEQTPSSYLEENEKSIDYVNKIWFVMAMVESGNDKDAEKWYKTLVEDNTAEGKTKENLPVKYIKAQDPGSDVNAPTAAACMLATRLGKQEDAQSFALYLAQPENRITEIYLLEQIYFLRSFKPENRGGEFAYTRNGERVNVSLNGLFSGKRVSFNKEQLEEADFKTISGTIYADVYYVAYPEDMDDEDNRKIKVSKTIKPLEGEEFKLGGLVEVRIAIDFSEMELDKSGYYSFAINDYVPSGLRFEKFKKSDNYKWYMKDRQGQQMTFSWYWNQKKAQKGEIVYYARIVTPGDYVVESTYVSSYLGDGWGSSRRSVINVKVD